MSVIFDITTYESSIKFLEEFLNIDSETIYNFIKSNPNDIYVDDFIEINTIDLESLTIENIEAVVLHVTSNDDECESIMKTGLMNLQQALTMDTPLKRHLKKYNIEFDISNNIMWVRSEAHEIKYDSNISGYEVKKDKLNSLARKIYFDHQIDGFFAVQNYKDYGGNVHKRPEFLHNIKELFKGGERIEDEWIEESKHYVIKFKAPLDEFAFCNFYSKRYEYEEDYETKEKIKTWLIDKALSNVWSYYYYKKGLNEFIAYMKPEVIIPFSKCEIIR